jgi:hypothetical protein
MKLLDACTSAFLVALSAVAGLGAIRLGLGEVNNPGSGLLPLGTAVLLGSMAAGQLVRSLLAAPSGPAGATAPPGRRWPVLAVVLATLLGCGLLLGSLGFSLSAFLMLLMLFGLVGRRRWWVTLAASLASVAAATLLFAALGGRFPPGPLGF